MKKTDSGEDVARPKPRKKGGRPKKSKGTSSPGSVAEKAIEKPQSKRDYRITSRGEVFRILANGRRQPVKPWFSGPYECVYIYGTDANNKYGRRKVYIHKLVIDHFGNEKKTSAKPFVHHKDGVERNNNITNLTYTSLEENLKARKYFYKDEGVVKKRGIKKNVPKDS